MRVDIYKEGESTVEVMNNLAEFLLKKGYIALCDEDAGVQECSMAACDFEVHVVRKRYAEQNMFKR